MKRLTMRSDRGHGYIPCHWKESAEAIDEGLQRLADIEDILGDNYDLTELSQIINAKQVGE